MASIYDIKPKFQRCLKPLVVWLHKNYISPNTITLLALLGSVLVGVLMLFASQDPVWLLFLPLWLFIRMALNAIDGMLARDYQLQSPLGGILNEVGDVVSDVALYLPFVVIAPLYQWPILFFILGAFLTEFCGVMGKVLGTERHYEGPMGKSDRAFVVGFLALVGVYWPSSMAYWGIAFWILFVLCLFTCYQRLIRILKEVPYV